MRELRTPRISSLETINWELAIPAAARSATSLGQRERARVQEAPQHFLLAGNPLVRLPQLYLAGIAASEVVDSVGLQPFKDRVAVERLEEPRHRVGPRLLALPGHAETEERRHHREAHTLAAPDEVLDRRQHAVVVAALPGG